MGRPPGFERFLRLTHTTRELLALIAFEYEARNFRFYSDKNMAAVLDVSRDTIIQSRKQLVAEGFLRPHIQKGRKRATVYETRFGIMPETRHQNSEKPDIKKAENPTSTTLSLTPRQYDLPLAEAQAACEAINLVPLKPPPPDQRRKAGEFPFKRIVLQAPQTKLDATTRKEAQAGFFRQAVEAAKVQEARGVPPSEDGDPKIAKGQPHPSREVEPITDSYHEDRGRDFSKITGGDNKAGLTAEDQARAMAEDEGKAQKERQRFLPGPVR